MGKVIGIVGTRYTKFHSGKWEASIKEFIDSLPSDTEIVINGAPGTDLTAANYAKSKGIPVTVLFPDVVYGDDPKFFIHRNTAVISKVDEVHAFWDGNSRGTRHAIVLAKSLNKPVHLHYVNDQDWEKAC